MKQRLISIVVGTIGVAALVWIAWSFLLHTEAPVLATPSPSPSPDIRIDIEGDAQVSTSSAATTTQTATGTRR